MQTGVSGFGVTAGGEAVSRVVLRGGGLTVALLTRGAVLQGVWLDGVDRNLTLGSEVLADYEGKMRHHGSLVGPVVNRIAEAGAVVGGVRRSFEANWQGQHTLHSGAAGTQFKVWALGAVTEASAEMTVHLPDGEGGFPGNRQITARFEVADSALNLTVTATTDAETPINFANHSYWNLDGTETWAGHHLRIAADRVLAVTEALIPTGEVPAVAGTPLDLRAGRVIAPGDPVMDTAFCLSDAPQPLSEVLWLTGASGLRLTLATTEASVQVYDGRAAVRPGREVYEGLAIEAQGWPDALSQPGFPQVTLQPGALYRQHTRFSFSQV